MNKINLNGHTGFVLEKLVIRNHPVFGEKFKINFIEKDDFNILLKSPYTSLIIGPNGTGKSLLLKIISDIFLDLSNLKNNLPKAKKHNDNYFKVSYFIGGEHFEISNYNQSTNFTKKRKTFEYSLNINKTPFEEFDSIQVPDSLIVSSLLLTDRFTVYKNSPEFYKYLGVRSLTSPTTARTRNYVKRTVELVVTSLASLDTEIINKIKELLTFLDFKHTFKIQYTPKYKDKFFIGKLTNESFVELFKNYTDPKKGFSNRKEMKFIPFGVQYFDRHVLDDKGLVQKLVDLLNEIYNSGKLKNKTNSKTEIFEYDILESELSLDKYELLNHLQQLDLITFPSVRLHKRDESIDLEQTSSGEYHIISNLIGIYASLSQNSLVLLDEPEVSLHPNWQMKYMSFLKEIFKDYASCQFITTTHSHFFASDLDGGNSKIIGLKRNDSNKIETLELPRDLDTFGWSAEEVLYSIFNVRSTRNSFFEYDLTKMVTMLNRNSTDFEEINRLVEKFSTLKLSKNDPLNIIIEKAIKYLNTYA
nr:AAA family ATPase [uncultured Flavobacterium sp.]